MTFTKALGKADTDFEKQDFEADGPVHLPGTGATQSSAQSQLHQGTRALENASRSAQAGIQTEGLEDHERVKPDIGLEPVTRCTRDERGCRTELQAVGGDREITRQIQCEVTRPCKRDS